MTKTGFNYDSGFVASRLQSWAIARALKKLSAYEDSGLTPERVAELAEAERDGRLVVLPCKVGGRCHTLRIAEETTIKSGIVEDILLLVKADSGEAMIMTRRNTFRSHAGAKAALAKMQEGG
ncbi:MAG: hypothetical protein FWE08_06055 [Oscillospiraceae bacterium]|nr:hypothetical protein [Oscillospiraceae bacterium]